MQRQACTSLLTRNIGLNHIIWQKQWSLYCNFSAFLDKNNFCLVYIHTRSQLYSFFELQIRMSKNVALLQTACIKHVFMFKRGVVDCVTSETDRVKCSNGVSAIQITWSSSIPSTSWYTNFYSKVSKNHIGT